MSRVSRAIRRRSVGPCRPGWYVVQAVGQLDQHHADVLGHGQEHLAQVLRLLLVAAIQAIPESLVPRPPGGPPRPEGGLDVLQGDRRVLGDVVQQPGHHRGPVHL